MVLAASFFFLMSPMLVNPIIAGFSNNVGANSVLAGIVAGMMNLTSLILRPLAGNLTDRFSKYRLSSIGWVATGFIILLLITIQFVGDKSVPHPDYRKNRTVHPKMRLVQPKVVPVAAILLLFSLPYFATQTYIVNYVFHRGFAIPAGAFFPVYALVLLAMRLILRDAFDRVPFKRFFWICLGCNLIGIIGLTDMDNWVMLIVGAVGLAAGYGLMFSICQAKSLTLVPKADRGLANSTFYIGIDLGMTLGPMLAGVITTYLPWAWLYPVMAVTLPVIVVVYWENHRGLA